MLNKCDAAVKLAELRAPHTHWPHARHRDAWHTCKPLPSRIAQKAERHPHARV